MKVSVLVPVYGVEKYIEQCAVSLFEQTYEDIEYIFVDDCSPDNSIHTLQSVLGRYPNRISQITILKHEKNKGLGAARKTALEASTGAFVLNVDSDDYLSIDAVEKLVINQQQTGADIVSGAYSSHYEDDTIVYHQEYHFNKLPYLRLMLIRNTIIPHIWARLIRKSIYLDNDIYSIEGIDMAEDLALTPRLFHAAKKVSVIDDSIYYYRDDSTASTFHNYLSEKNIVSFLKANQVLWSYFNGCSDVSFAYELGMLNAYYIALKGNYTTHKIKKILPYAPSKALFRVIYALFAHKITLPIFRFIYLAIKWCYKKKLHFPY